LFGGLTIADLQRGNVSRRRNPLIADLFRRVEMVESWGRGMTLIHQKAPTVAFRQVGGLFIASFARPSFESGQENKQQRTTSTTTSTTTGRAALLLEHLHDHPRTTIPEMARVMGMTEDGVNYHLRRLQAAGQLRREGGRSAGHWVVVQTDNNGAKPPK
jgi:ATP-dependent DNA helicase RecG